MLWSMEVTQKISTENFAYSKEMRHPPCGKRGFEIFQNIENHHLLQCDTPKWLDYITKYTVDKLDTNGKSKKRSRAMEEEKNIANIPG